MNFEISENSVLFLSFLLLVYVKNCSAGFPFSIPFLDDAEWVTGKITNLIIFFDHFHFSTRILMFTGNHKFYIIDLFGVGPRAPAQLSPCECINPWVGYNGSEAYVSMKM